MVQDQKIWLVTNDESSTDKYDEAAPQRLPYCLGLFKND
jgi:hypothetical protein